MHKAADCWAALAPYFAAMNPCRSFARRLVDPLGLPRFAGATDPPDIKSPCLITFHAFQAGFYDYPNNF
jgi:hypothetical protein